jgi:predicted nuclease of predicted toxin-antitoxin system
VRLLLDQNLSYRLVRSLSDVFPNSLHVHDVGLARADDDAVWAYALDHDLIIVSKDSDFRQRSFLQGAPPKVVWIRRGNCSTQEIDGLLRVHQNDLLAFANDEAAAFLVLS